MATIKQYDTAWNLLKTWTDGAAINERGVWKDQDFFWVVDSVPSLKQYSFDGAGNLYLERSVNLPYSGAWGIVGDGAFFYIGVAKTVVNEEITVLYKIIRASRAGTVIKEYNAVSVSTLISSYYDLTYDGLNVYFSYSAINHFIGQFDPVLDVRVKDTGITRPMGGIAINGQNYITHQSGAGVGYVLDRAGTIIKAVAATGLAVSGLCWEGKNIYVVEV